MTVSSPRSLPRSAPSAQGVDAAGLSAFLDALEADPEIELHSLMVIRHGQVVAEGWWAPYSADRVHLLHSLSKSFTSTAAGFAVAEGLLDLDAPVVSYFEEFDADITDERSRRILVRHVLAMASGHRAETLERALALDPQEPVRGFLLLPPEEEPGTVFAYNQPCTYAVAAIIQKLTGQPLTEYLRPRLFEPLGIDRYGWMQQPPGRDLGFSGLYTTTEAVAHLGQLYLQRGRWDGRQLLSEDWVAEATRSHVANPNEANPDWQQGYGFQFWMARHGYRGDGAFGQFCIVLPEEDVVIATTASTENMQAILDAVWAHVLPAIDAAGDPAADRGLSQRLAAAELPALVAEAEPVESDTWAGHEFAVVDEPATPPTLRGVRLERGDDGWWLVLLESPESSDSSDSSESSGDDEPLRGRIGSGNWQVSEDAAPIAVSGGWVAPDRFRADVLFLETPHRLRLECAGAAATAHWVAVPLHQGPLRDKRMP